jgi:large subunit ribosomal protein L32e
MNMPKFVRKDAKKKIRFHIKRKIKWRRQKGRDSKIRQKMKSYPKMPDIGYGSPKKTRHLVQGKQPILIHSVKELMAMKHGPNQIIVIAHTSLKNKIEIAKKAKEKNLKILNLNIKKTLKKERIKVKTEIKKEIKTENKEPSKEVKK